MGLAMNVLTALLVFIAAASAIPAHFPHGKTLHYKYYGDVKAGIIELAPYASQFGLKSDLYIKHYTSDPLLNNAYYVTLQNCTFGLYNGKAVHSDMVGHFLPIAEDAKAIEKPFLIVYDDNFKFQGIKFQNEEPRWSKNIKQSIASILQLNVPLISSSKAFVMQENTIHGNCHVTYNVHLKDRQKSNVFVVTKFYEPANCTNFVQKVFDQVECDKCYVEPENPMSTASRRVFEIEEQGQEIVITKLIGHGVINYFPWQARSEAHYLLNNQTFILETVTEMDLPVVDFQKSPLITDISFKLSNKSDIITSQDLIQERSKINAESLVMKVKTMLIEASNYLKEYRVEMEEPNWKHEQLINRIHQTMLSMDLKLFEELYYSIQNLEDVNVRNIFLQIVPTVGTVDSCIFIKNVIYNSQSLNIKVSDINAITMLHKLPMYVKSPNVQLLEDMEVLIDVKPNVNMDVRVAGILCFSTLIHKTFKDKIIDNALIEKYLKKNFYEHIKTETTYYMKMVYLMAMKNVQLQCVHVILEPIIRGKEIISEKPYHIRTAAIWAIEKTIQNDLQYGYNLLWPVLANTSLPLTVRIAAYNVLINQLPYMGRFMNIYWFMVYEKNEHLYNYHVTTIKGLSNSVDPCLRPIREMARKILRFTRMRSVYGSLSANYLVDYVYPKYEFGETVKTSLILNEITGVPHVGSVQYIHMSARKRVPIVGIYWSVNGLDEIMNMINKQWSGNIMEIINDENVINILKKTAKDMPVKENIYVDLAITVNDQVVQTIHLDKDNWMTIFDKVKDWKNIISNVNVNVLGVIYDTFYEMYVPTDMGLEAVLTTKIPVLLSAKLNTVSIKDNVPLNMNLKFDTHLWKHGEYVMSMYNPIVDIWHSIRRVTTKDIKIPAAMNIFYNNETSNVKLTFKMNEFLNLGALSYVKNYVTITEDEEDKLKKSCDTCKHYEVVTKGDNYKKTYDNTYELKGTGLQYFMTTFDCENSNTPATKEIEWMQAFSSENKNTWNNKIIQFIMGLRQHSYVNFISPEMGTCGSIVMIKPKITDPCSNIVFNVWVNIKDLDHVVKKMHVLSSKKINIHGTLDVVEVCTNTITHSWDLNFNFESNPTHINNNLKVQITRTAPGEKKLKICIDGQKNYPVFNSDYLKVGEIKEETNTKVTVTMDMTEKDECVSDEMVIKMTIKGEMSEEQKEQMAHDNVNGACAKDVQNPLITTQQGHVPKTWNCLHRSILYSTMRKYSMNVTYKQVPQSIISKMIMLDDMIRVAFLPQINYTTNVEPTSVKLMVEYPVGTDNMDVSVVTANHGYKISEIPLGNKLWNVLMDNTHFSTNFLQNLYNHQLKICTVYPQILVMIDNNNIPYKVPDQWTLVSGDYVYKTFAVFVKVVENIMSTKVIVGEHVLEIVPTENESLIMINGTVVVNPFKKGIVEPRDDYSTYAFKITDNNENIIVHSKHVPIKILCTSNSMTIIMDSLLQGHMTGICKNNSINSHKKKLPKIYSTLFFEQ
ncbi:LOW QUALITY PROTEIN: uncharacterized protein LOC124421789 [Vespa crabro]|uniref:LOW QUALITY PROTEIN: uncharacterized protein LOC124421789 n=1 Tax=Vespa crabro TaxID=7445 RepID=UPI001F009D85|nr:LOW QUALITY PROTEIN: uncharacterized protein LOC124421789 [Vespa crabro]